MVILVSSLHGDCASGTKHKDPTAMDELQNAIPTELMNQNFKNHFK